MSRAKLLTTRNGHGQSKWSPIGCDDLYFHAMRTNRVSVSGGSVSAVKAFTQNWTSHPKSTPSYFSCALILSVTHLIFYNHYHNNDQYYHIQYYHIYVFSIKNTEFPVVLFSAKEGAHLLRPTPPRPMPWLPSPLTRKTVGKPMVSLRKWSTIGG